MFVGKMKKNANKKCKQSVNNANLIMNRTNKITNNVHGLMNFVNNIMNNINAVRGVAGGVSDRANHCDRSALQLPEKGSTCGHQSLH